ncbi:MAG TPA: aromatic ring-hydroxylating dioxygenase subunit alpha [Bryobacteraceae bacterium]|nr:aromatic ring-hydroxylating dioxygenase subunit alpha [Bryobacteraceae bacterium]
MYLTLPARYYTDPAFFREELEWWYFREWICAGRADAIPEPGDYFLRDVAGESVIVVRDGEGRIRAFYNVCRHRGTRLCKSEEGRFDGRIQCPYHGWTYGLDGGLRGAPHMEPSTFSAADYPLREVGTGVWDGHLFLHLGTPAEPLEEQLGKLPAKFTAWRMHDLRLYRRTIYEVKANWKLLVLNYNECLHCPMVHPRLNRLTDYLGADNEEPQPGYVGGAMGFREGAETMSTDGKMRRAYLPGLGQAERRKVCYYSVYPNLLLSLHPDYMMVHTLWPIAADHTRVICEWHFHPEEMARRDFIADDAIELWDATNREDWEVVELSQAGIQSRAYTPGPYSHREELLHGFEQAVLERERRARAALYEAMGPKGS